MTTTLATVNRIFNYMGMMLDDPDPRMSLDEVKQHYSLSYPGMLNAVVDGGEFDGENMVYQVTRATGTKGRELATTRFETFRRAVDGAAAHYDGHRKRSPIRVARPVTRDMQTAAHAAASLASTFHRTQGRTLPTPHWNVLPPCF